ncbi:hypothetical protein JXB27_04630 [Candidatus Woesearchaeota archaeon]|nr:hypothetical protein [Candidatus Woesearchaeota archaeon]
MKKLVLFLLATVLLFSACAPVEVVKIGDMNTSENTTEKNIYACEKDEDCILTRVGCCGCNFVAVNKNYEGIYAGNCDGMACIAIACKSSPPKCIDNRCQLVSTIGECPKITNIDCQPIVQARYQYYCLPENRKWIEANCDIEIDD